MSQNIQQEVFISYAHRDNLSIRRRDEDRWITNLHRSLEIRVGQLMGENIAIWLDNKELRGDDYFDDVIFDHIKKIPIMICVLSPSYNNSKYCKMELEAFFKFANQNGGVRLGNKSRIFKVVKTYVPLAEHPAELQAMLGYEFYKKEETVREDAAKRPELDPNADQSYWDKLEDLANDLAKGIRLVRNYETPQPPSQPKPSIYLAETTFDLSLERDRIKRELLERKFNVLPDKPLPINVTEIEAVCREYLKMCKLSIHLIGSKHGIIPEGDEERSVQRIQCDLASEQGNGSDFSRLIWMPQGLVPEGRRQQEFVEYLKANASGQGSTELLQTSLEELKTVIQDKLFPRPVVKPPEQAGSDDNDSETGEALASEPLDDGLIRIYLICDQRDFDNVNPLGAYIYDYDQAFEVVYPLTEGSEAQNQLAHKNSLSTCDAALLYYGRGNEFWLRSKLDDLLRSRYGRRKPWMATAIYMTKPLTKHKEIYRVRDPLLIKALDDPEGEFSRDLLAPFLNQIVVAKGGRKCG